MTKMRFELFDGIRGIAALFVLMRHTSTLWGVRPYHSYLAVDVFFVMSGFVIAYMYDSRLASAELSLKRFATLRLVRLYPIFLLSVGVAALLFIARLYAQHELTPAVWSNALSVIALSLVFLPSHFQSDTSLFPLNGPYWSLFFELVVNFIYAALRRRLTRGLHLAILLVAAVVLAGAAFAGGNLDLGFEWTAVSLTAGLARSVFGFFAGVYLFQQRAALLRYVRWAGHPALALLAVVAVLTLPDCGAWNPLLDLFCVLVVFPMVALLASCDFQRSASASGVLTMLGSASYPVYVLHAPLSKILGFLLKKMPVPVGGVVLVLVVVGAALLLEKFYDIPVRKYLTRKTTPAQAVPLTSGR